MEKSIFNKSHKLFLNICLALSALPVFESTKLLLLLPFSSYGPSDSRINFFITIGLFLSVMVGYFLYKRLWGLLGGLIGGFALDCLFIYRYEIVLNVYMRLLWLFNSNIPQEVIAIQMGVLILSAFFLFFIGCCSGLSAYYLIRKVMHEKSVSLSKGEINLSHCVIILNAILLFFPVALFLKIELFVPILLLLFIVMPVNTCFIIYWLNRKYA